MSEQVENSVEQPVMEVIETIHKLTDEIESALQSILRIGSPMEASEKSDICEVRLSLECLKDKHSAILNRINL